MTKRRLGVVSGYAISLLAIAFATCASAATQYVYDDAGRLIQVVETDGTSIQYQYDSVGNVLSVTRTAAATVAVSSFSPSAGVVGTSVTIHGSGFNPVANQNTVKFNGTTATVTSASANTLTATVPSGASTGVINVTNSGGSANSGAAFTVTALAITDFTPKVGPLGTVVTIAGTGFDSIASNDQISFGSVSAVTSSASSSQLKASATGPGRIVVTTPLGSVTSSADFIPTPPGYAPGDVIVSGHLTVGGSALIYPINTANKVGVAMFDGTLGQSMSLVMTNVTMSAGATFTIYRPDGVSFFSGNIANNTVVDLPPLTMTGTYEIVLTPTTHTGSVTLNIVTDLVGSVLTDGTPLAVSLTGGQNASLTFAGVAGMSYSLALTGYTSNPAGATVNYTYKKPDGSTFTTAWGCAPRTSSGGGCDISPLPVTGTYTIKLDPSGLSATSFSVVLSQDLSGTLNIDDPTTTFNATVPGQNIRYSFAGTAGQRVTFIFTNNTIAKGTYFVVKPDQTVLANSVYSGVGGSTVDMVLPATGSYTLVLYVDEVSTGHMDLRLVSDFQATVLTDGTPLAVSLAAGQNATLSFTGVANATYNLALMSLTSNPSGTTVSIAFRKPDGSTFTSGWTCVSFTATTGNCDINQLPVSGTYALTLNPSGLGTTSFNVQLARAVEGTIVVGGSSVTYNSTIPGQNALYSFSGTSGQALTLDFSTNNIPSGGFYVFRSNGTLIANRTIGGVSSGSLAIPALPATDTYTIVLFVDDRNTGHVTLTLH